jgi:hypothetical protein
LKTADLMSQPNEKFKNRKVEERNCMKEVEKLKEENPPILPRSLVVPTNLMLQCLEYL